MAVISNRGISVPWFEGSGLLLSGIGLAAAVCAVLVAIWRRRVLGRTGAPARTGLWAIPVFVVILVAGWLAGGFAGTVPDLDGRATTGGIRSTRRTSPSCSPWSCTRPVTSRRSSGAPSRPCRAGRARPLTPWPSVDSSGCWYVVLPQAFRIALPPVGNQYLNLIKNSSLGAAIGYYDLTLVTQTAVGNGAPAVPAFAITLTIYIGISLVTSLLVNVANRRLALRER